MFHLVLLCSSWPAFAFGRMVSLALTDRWDDPVGACRWPSGPWGAPLLSSLLRWPPACLLLSLSLKNFDRKGNLTLSMGQRWRREQESGGCILTFCRKTAVVVQPALFLKSWQFTPCTPGLPANLQKQRLCTLYPLSHPQRGHAALVT